MANSQPAIATAPSQKARMVGLLCTLGISFGVPLYVSAFTLAHFERARTHGYSFYPRALIFLLGCARAAVQGLLNSTYNAVVRPYQLADVAGDSILGKVKTLIARSVVKWGQERLWEDRRNYEVVQWLQELLAHWYFASQAPPLPNQSPSIHLIIAYI